MNRILGISLIELVVCLALLAVLTTACIPYFSFQSTKQLEIVREQFIQSIYFARTEAIKRNSMILLCPSQDGLRCSGTWSSGLLVMHHKTPLQFFQYPNTRSITCRNHNAHKRLSFNATGKPHVPKNTRFECWNAQDRLFTVTLTRMGKVKTHYS